MSIKNILEADSINLEFGGRPILSDVYVKVETNTITGFLGRNGSGKSCLMKVIFGTMAATYQSVRVNKEYLPKPFEVKGMIRYLPQHSFLPKHLKIKEISEFYNVSLAAIFEDFPFLEKISEQKIYNLSGGEQRIFEVMLILKSDVKFVILDEPFSALMPLHTDRLKEIISQEKSKKGIIITDHLYKHIMDLSDNLYLMREGKSFIIKELEDLVRFGYLLQI